MPSRIDIPLSGSAPGNGSAGLDGDVPRNAALAVRMLRYERVPVLDKQTGRPQEGPVMVGGKPLRNPDGSVRTGPVGTISGFYGETLCSHEKVFMRLSTDQEERADGSATGVSPNRHDLSVMVYAATPGIRRGRYGELVDIESLPDAEKPVMFCQRVVPLRDPRSGGPVLAGDGSLKCRAGWFTVLGNFKNEEGAEVRQLDHMTADRVSSVSMVLDAKWFAAVRESLRESCAAGIQSYGKAASLAARDVMEKFTGEAAKAAETDGSQPSSLGRLSVTSWYPERHIRVLNGEGKEEARRTLEAWLADPKFQKRLVQGPDGMPTERDSPVAPDMIVRLLNEKGEAAGAVRLSSWLLNRVAEAEAKGQNDPGAAMARLATPAGRAEWIMDILGKVSVTSGEKLAGFDVLTGESCRVSRSFTQPGAFGTGYGGRRVLHQTGEGPPAHALPLPGTGAAGDHRRTVPCHPQPGRHRHRFSPPPRRQNQRAGNAHDRKRRSPRLRRLPGRTRQGARGSAQLPGRHADHAPGRAKAGQRHGSGAGNARFPRPRAVLDFPERSKKAAVCRISPPAVSRPFWRFSSEYKIFSADW